MSLERVTDLARQLGQHKRLAVGATSPLSPFPERSVNGNSVTFKDTVTALWTWYCEQIQHDIQFLLSRATKEEKSILTGFNQLLNDQRHLNEHADYDRAKQAEAWRTSHTAGGSPSDRCLVDALFLQLKLALETLCLVACRVGKNEMETVAWRNHVKSTPESQVLAALANIGRDNISQARLNYAVRRFNQHPEVRKGKPLEVRAGVAAVIALEINLKPLSVPYDRILDEFGLIGDRGASSLLIIAHGVEAAGHKDKRLMDVLRKTWPVVGKTLE